MTRRSAWLLFPVFQGAPPRCLHPSFPSVQSPRTTASISFTNCAGYYYIACIDVRHICYGLNVLRAQLRVVWLCVSPLPSLPCCTQSAHCAVNNASRLNLPTNRVLLRFTGTALYEPLTICLLHFVPLVWVFPSRPVLSRTPPVRLYLLAVLYHLCFSFASFSNILL